MPQKQLAPVYSSPPSERLSGLETVMHKNGNAVIRNMTKDDARQLFIWASGEGWNPGVCDLDCAWAVDPQAFIGLYTEETLAGGGSIFRHSEDFGFMGLFIVRPALRSSGLGKRLWHTRLEMLKGRLSGNAAIGLDGVFRMEGFYARGGFKTAYRTYRFEGIAPKLYPVNGAAGGAASAAELADYDSAILGYDRSGLLREWLDAPATHVEVIREGGLIRGYGIVRSAESGTKFGPILADKPEVFEALIVSLFSRQPGVRFQIDIPETCHTAMQAAERWGFQRAFGCARMYSGKEPETDFSRLYSAMSLEFG